MKNGMIFVAAAAFLILASALPAGADVIVTVNCTAGGQSATQNFLIQCDAGTSDWTLPGSVAMLDENNTLLATIKGLSFQSDAEPYVNLHFSVDAGLADTTFDITSAVLSFGALSNPQAYATAAVTLTSDSDGATITGLLDGGKVYRAIYNGSTVYAGLVDGFSVSPDDSQIRSDRNPPASGYATIVGSASSIQSEFDFTLSALDQASGTSRFEMIPEPMTMSLLALGGLAMLRRNRK